MSAPTPVSRLMTLDVVLDAKDADQASEFISDNIDLAEVRPLRRGASVRMDGSFGFAKGLAVWRKSWPDGADLKPLTDVKQAIDYIMSPLASSITIGQLGDLSGAENPIVAIWLPARNDSGGFHSQ